MFFYLLESEQNVRNMVLLYIQDIDLGEKTKEGYHFLLLKKKSMAILKQVAGIDVAQNELVVSLGRMDDELTLEIIAYRVFSNTPSGFKELVKWVGRQFGDNLGLRYVMEATGAYHEALAHYLSDNGSEVSIVLPNKISNFFRTLECNTITDKTASEAIARFGLERKLAIWQKPKRIFMDIKQLTRERDQMIADRTVLKNQLHAEKAGAFPNPGSIGRLEKRISLIDMQEVEILAEIATVISRDPELAEKIKLVTTIPGVGKLTAAIVLSETNGFELITSKKQLVSYSGLDVKLKDSGTSVRSKPRISKKGNRHIRKAMHMPALTAMRYNEQHKDLFVRLVSKHGIKMKAAVAVQRKILELIYSIFRSGKPFDKNYIQANMQKHPEMA